MSNILFVVSILMETIEETKKNKDSEILIFWDKDNICDVSTMNPQDKIAKLFLPQLMIIKDSLRRLEGDVELQVEWIKASLCDGEDEKSEELLTALETKSLHSHKICLQIRSQVENIVHSLNRLEIMKQHLPQIHSAVIKKKSNKGFLKKWFSSSSSSISNS